MNDLKVYLLPLYYRDNYMDELLRIMSALNDVKNYTFQYMLWQASEKMDVEKYKYTVQQLIDSEDYDIVLFSIILDRDNITHIKSLTDMLKTILDKQRIKCMFVITYAGALNPSTHVDEFCRILNSPAKTYENKKDFLWYCTSDVVKNKKDITERMTDFLKNRESATNDFQHIHCPPACAFIQLCNDSIKIIDSNQAKCVQTVINQPIRYVGCSLLSLIEDIRKASESVMQVQCVIIAINYNIVQKLEDILRHSQEVITVLKDTATRTGNHVEFIVLISEDTNVILDGDTCSETVHGLMKRMLHEIFGDVTSDYKFLLLSWNERYERKHIVALHAFMKCVPKLSLNSIDTDQQDSADPVHSVTIVHKETTKEKQVAAPKVIEEPSQSVPNKISHKVFVANFDKTVCLDSVYSLLNGVKTSCKHLDFEPIQLQASISTMKTHVDDLNKKASDGECYDFAIFAVHAHESRLNINEPSAGIGYYTFYQALRAVTNDRVVVVFVGDSSNDDHVLSSWVLAKVSTQFTQDYIDGENGLLISWNQSPSKGHFKALKRFLRRVHVLVLNSNLQWACNNLFENPFYCTNSSFTTGACTFGAADNQESLCILKTYLQEKCDILLFPIDARYFESCLTTSQEPADWENFKYLIPILVNRAENYSLVIVVTEDKTELTERQLASTKVLQKLKQIFNDLLSPDHCLVLSLNEEFNSMQKTELKKWLFKSKITVSYSDKSEHKVAKDKNKKDNVKQQITGSREVEVKAATNKVTSEATSWQELGPKTKKGHEEPAEHYRNDTAEESRVYPGGKHPTISTLLEHYEQRVNNKWHVLGARLYNAKWKQFTDELMFKDSNYTQYSWLDPKALLWVKEHTSSVSYYVNTIGKNRDQFWVVYQQAGKDLYSFAILEDELNIKKKHN